MFLMCRARKTAVLPVKREVMVEWGGVRGGNRVDQDHLDQEEEHYFEPIFHMFMKKYNRTYRPGSSEYRQRYQNFLAYYDFANYADYFRNEYWNKFLIDYKLMMVKDLFLGIKLILK